MPAEPPDLVDALGALGRALVGITARALAAAPTEVTIGQYRALVVLGTTGPVRSAALGAELGLSPSATSRLVDRLVRRSLVDRTPSAVDRREVEITITAEGWDLVRTVMAARDEELASLVEVVAPSRRAAAARALAVVAEAAGEQVVPLGELGPGSGRGG